MDFVIWGVGARGKRVFEFVGQEKIAAFIDSNKNIVGTEYSGKPIIDFETYKNNYSQNFIIISPAVYQEIIEFLRINNVYNYFILPECPPEVYMFRVFPLFKKFPLKYDKSSCNAIYGINLFSILLYEYLQENGCENLYLIPHIEIDDRLLDELNECRYYRIDFLKNISMKIDKMFLTVPKEEKQIMNDFPNSFVIENAFDYTDKIEEYYNPQIEQFKEMHKGKRCFIVATGPSLHFEDLDCLHRNKEISISMNHIFCAFQNTGWRPDYYVCQDMNVIKDYNLEICEADIKYKFISDYYMPFWDSPKTMYRFHGHAEEYFPNKPKFSTDLSRKVYDGYTVTYTCIQLAAYMGFHEIFLLGVDFNYSAHLSSSENHFYKNYEKEKNKVNRTALPEMLLAYQKARQYAELNGMKIFNATRGGKLEVFERVDFDSLFE